MCKKNYKKYASLFGLFLRISKKMYNFAAYFETL